MIDALVKQLQMLERRVARLEAQERPDGLNPSSGVARAGYAHGPAVEIRRILDYNDDGTPYTDAGGEQQVRYGIFLLGQTGAVGANLLTGTQAQPNHSTLVLLADPPSSAADTGTPGEVRVDASAVYVCTAVDTWKKIGIATW